MWLAAAILMVQAPVGIYADEIVGQNGSEPEEQEAEKTETSEDQAGEAEDLAEDQEDETEVPAGNGAEETGAYPAGEEISAVAEPADGNEENASGITTWSGLQRAVTSANTTETTITLEQDIIAEEGNSFLSIPQQAKLTLDLNGHKLDRNHAGGSAVEDGCVIKLEQGKGSADNKLTKLTIIDSSEAGTGMITGGNSNSSAGGVYVQANTLFTLVSGTISGNTANNGGGVFVANSGTFLQEGGTICGNTAKGSGGGVNVAGSFTLNSGVICDNKSTGTGGGVYNSGSFTMDDGTICYNTAGLNGSGVYNAGTFTMDDGTICDNEAIRNGGGVYNDGTLTMNGGTVCDNTATENGGGVYDKRTFVMNNGRICNNTSKGADTDQGGGGVYIAYATYADFSMTGGSIFGNTASGDGGGVFANKTFTMTGGSISANHSERYGGGVCNVGKCYISGNIAVSGNTAGSAVNNVHLSTQNTYIYISGSISPGSSVGVTTANDPQNANTITVTSGLKEKPPAITASFSAIRVSELSLQMMKRRPVFT